MARIKTQVITHAGEDIEQGEHSSIASGSANLCNHFRNQFGSSQKTVNSSASSPSYTIPGYIPKGLYACLTIEYLLINAFAVLFTIARE